MKYTLLAVVIVLAVGAFLFYVGLAVRRRVLEAQKQRRQRARAMATWSQDFYTEGGNTMVVVRKIAKDGSWSEVMDQQFVGMVAQARPDHDEVFDTMQAQALKRVYQLNTGPLM
jgi:hypothetical protein